MGLRDLDRDDCRLVSVRREQLSVWVSGTLTRITMNWCLSAGSIPVFLSLRDLDKDHHELVSVCREQSCLFESQGP